MSSEPEFPTTRAKPAVDTSGMANGCLAAIGLGFIVLGALAGLTGGIMYLMERIFG